MTRREILRDLHGLDRELASLEEEYGLLSSEFYELYRTGRLTQTRDFIRWVGFHEAHAEREGRYRALGSEPVRTFLRQNGSDREPAT
jgi:hypothetical protein